MYFCVSWVYVCVCSFMCNTCRFPLADGLRVREWLRRMRWQNWWPTGNSVLCSDHFEKDCFEQVGSHKRLRKNAVPTIFNFPKHLQWKASQTLIYLFFKCCGYVNARISCVAAASCCRFSFHKLFNFGVLFTFLFGAPRYQLSRDDLWYVLEVRGITLHIK